MHSGYAFVYYFTNPSKILHLDVFFMLYSHNNEGHAKDADFEVAGQLPESKFNRTSIILPTLFISALSKLLNIWVNNKGPSLLLS